MEKVLSLILMALLPMVINLPVQAYDFKNYGICYKILDNNTVEVTYGISYSGNIEIPNSFYYNGKTYTVKGIGYEAFSDCRNLNSVTIPNSVTYISRWAFSYCSGLTSIKIPNSVTSIDNNAFTSCRGLTSITIPSSVTFIGDGAFSYCSGLTSIVSTLSDPFNIADNVFSYYTAKLIVPPGKVNIYRSKSGWKNFGKIVEVETKQTIHVAKAGTLPKLIPEYEKDHIEELTLTGELNGTDIRFIRQMAGVDFAGLMRDDVHYISTNGKLKSLDISNAIIVRGGEEYMATDEAFETHSTSNDKLSNAYYTNDNAISCLMFYGTKLKSILLPNSITSIGPAAFRDCKYLTSITIPQDCNKH